MSCPGLSDVVLTNCWWVSSILVPCPTPTPICQAWNCLSTISMATSPQPVPRALAKSRLGRASQLPSRRERSFSRMLRNSPGLGVQRPRAKSCLCSLTWFESPAFTQSMFAHLSVKGTEELGHLEGSSQPVKMARWYLRQAPLPPPFSWVAPSCLSTLSLRAFVEQKAFVLM